MKLLEQMPDTISQKIQSVLTHEEEELIRVSTDLNPDGTFGEQWVIATDRRVIVVPAEGVNGIVDVPIGELAAVQTEPLVGGGRLEIERKKEATSSFLTLAHLRKNSLRWHVGLSNFVSKTIF